MRVLLPSLPHPPGVRETVTAAMATAATAMVTKPTGIAAMVIAMGQSRLERRVLPAHEAAAFRVTGVRLAKTCGPMHGRLAPTASQHWLRVLRRATASAMA